MQQKCRRGFTLMELMIAIAIIFAIVTVAIPNLLAARIRTNEVSAIRMIQTIHTAQAQCQSETGKFATALAQLQKWTSKKLAGGRHTGYDFTVEGTGEDYRITAKPERPGSTGKRVFTSDQTLILYDADGNEVAN